MEVEREVWDFHGDDTQDWMESIFAQVFSIYANAGFTVQISEFLIWDTEDPYTGSTSEKLNQFRERHWTLMADGTRWNGDLAHLVGFTGGGGIAYIDVICNDWYAYAYSAINNGFANIPTYSWTVMVLAHELGHNFGAPHTHDCVWSDTGYGD